MLARIRSASGPVAARINGQNVVFFFEEDVAENLAPSLDELRALPEEPEESEEDAEEVSASDESESEDVPEEGVSEESVPEDAPGDQESEEKP